VHGFGGWNVAAPLIILAAMDSPSSTGDPALVRGIGAWDATLITIGSVLGSGIFITTGDIARSLPHGGLIVLVWIAGGLLTLTGALTYAELGSMFPRTGGQYHYLKEAYGPLSGFLFGWAAFLVIMTGGIAALSVGFGEYLGYYIPFFSTGHILFSFPLGSVTRTVNGGQLAGAIVIAVLTAVNYVGLRKGALLQNVVTVAKVASLLGLAGFGLLVPARTDPSGALLASLPSGNAAAAFGVGMIAALWSYDGWYAVSNIAGEMKKPSRDLPVGLIAGVLAVTLLYTVMNLVYVRALSIDEMAATGRIGESAAHVLFGPVGAQIVTAAVIVSIFGCISSTILYAARIYLPMAREGSFFPALATIHPRYRTPGACLIAQGVWSAVLTFSGSYEQLYTYVVFALVVFHSATGAAVFVLRRTRPEAARPYRTWGYPVMPALFVLVSLALVANTLRERPIESLIGSAMIAAGIPAYLFWRRRAGQAGRSKGQLDGDPDSAG
jgi:APA family basic amino acid/polyamine antiporter